jgi:predicted Rossmann fold flavoprotein
MILYDIVIVGAGASGLISAIVSAKRGKRVLILEKNNKIGKKLLATGNGKCNITNIRPTLERFHSKNQKFIRSVLESYNYQSIKQFFKSIGLELIEAKEGRVFPMSLQASSVVDILSYECEQLGVKILCEANVEDINYNKSIYTIRHTKGKAISKNLIISTGHQSAPQLGGVDDGIFFAKKFGHKRIDSFPSLVQLTSSMPNFKALAGVRIDSKVRLYKKDKKIEKKGDVLFTSYGISGLAILDISRFVLEELFRSSFVKLEIDLLPKMSREQLIAIMKKSLRKDSIKPIDIWLQGFINKKLIYIIIKSLGYEKLLEQNINITNISKIVENIKAFEFIVNGSRGYKGCEVATGGIDTSDINPKTMESKIQKGLYLTGEVLDVDADRGGFNLHFAWVSGIRAGKSV